MSELGELAIFLGFLAFEACAETLGPITAVHAQNRAEKSADMRTDAHSLRLGLTSRVSALSRALWFRKRQELVSTMLLVEIQPPHPQLNTQTFRKVCVFPLQVYRVPLNLCVVVLLLADLECLGVPWQNWIVAALDCKCLLRLKDSFALCSALLIFCMIAISYIAKRSDE